MEVQEYRLSWDTNKQVGFIALKANREWSSWQEYTYQNFMAAVQILQNEQKVFVNKQGYWTGPEQPGQ